jgi:hypothetical protein
VWGPAVTVVAAGANKVYNGGLAVEPGGTVDLVYIDNQCGQYNVYLKQYTGGVMGAALPAMNECVGKNRARVVYAGGRVHVVFRRDLDIYYTSFAAGGWSTAVNISNSPATQSYNPDIATNGSAIFISWGENQNNHDVLLRYSPDSGQSWSGEMSVSGSAPVFADMATLTWVPAVNRGYIVWSDASNGVGGKNDIYFHEFEATPASFTNPVKVSCIDADSNWPVIAAGPGKAEIVWQDRSVGNQLYLFHLAGQVGNGQVTISCGAAAPVSTPVPAIPPGATVTPFPTTPLATPTKGPTPTLSFPTLGAPIDTTAPRPTDVSYVSDPKPVQYDASTPWILFILVGGIVLVFGHGIFF